MPKYTPELKFWNKVAYIGASDNECWEWRGSLRSNGYGQYGTLRLKAHRVAWQLTYGTIPKLHVLHTCDNPKCVNPSHLYLGTDADNTRDKVGKNRQAKGQMLPQTKLTPEIVSTIRFRYETEKITQRQLGFEYSVCQATICLILMRKNWKD